MIRSTGISYGSGEIFSTICSSKARPIFNASTFCKILSKYPWPKPIRWPLKSKATPGISQRSIFLRGKIRPLVGSRIEKFPGFKSVK